MKDGVRAGDAVEVPWGFGRTRGVVETILGPSTHPHALVRVVLTDSTGDPLDEETISLPLSDLRPVSRSA